MTVRTAGTHRGGFTLIELLVVITIIGILAAIALPNYIKAKDKAKEVQVKSSVKALQIAVERYHTDFEEYPLFLLGGDVEGWRNWHQRHDEPNPNTLGANAWVRDPLVGYAYMDSYPINPFVDNGNAVLQQTGPATAPAAGYAPGDGDPRFGFRGNLMGNGLEDPMCFLNWFNDNQMNIETYRTLFTSTGGNVQAKGFGSPNHTRYPGGGSNPQGLHYAMGGRLGQVTENGVQRPAAVYVHWPGNFFYRGFPERLMARKGWTVWFPQAFVKASTLRYIMGAYGSYTTEGTDVIRLEPIGLTGQRAYYKLPPPWNAAGGDATIFPLGYGWTGTGGGLPEIAGGGNAAEGPWLPPDRSTDYPNAFIYGAPDGFPDSAILILTAGDEIQAY